MQVILAEQMYWYSVKTSLEEWTRTLISSNRQFQDVMGHSRQLQRPFLHMQIGQIGKYASCSVLENITFLCVCVFFATLLKVKLYDTGYLKMKLKLHRVIVTLNVLNH